MSGMKPKEADALVRRAATLATSGQPDEARQMLASAVAAAPDHVEARAALARLAREAGDLEAAAEHLRVASARAPGRPKLTVELGYALRALGRRAEARSLVASVLAAHPDLVPALLLMAVLEQEAGAAAAAVEAARRAVGLAPGNRHAATELARFLMADGRADEARVILARLAGEPPPDGAVQMALGRLERGANRPEAALAAFEAALGVDPGNVNARLAAAECLLQLGRLDEADARAMPPAVESGQKIWRLMVLARIAEARRDPTGAIGHLTAARSPAPLVRLASLFRSTGEIGRMLAVIRAAYELAPDDEAVIGQVTAILHLLRHGPKARAFLEACYARAPANRPIALRLARELVAAGDIDAAAAVAARFSAGPPVPEVQRVVAHIHAADGRYEAAREALAALRPEEAASPVRLDAADHAMNAGDFDTADRLLAGGVPAARAEAVRHLRLKSNLALHRGDLEGATSAVESALALAADDIDLHRKLAVIAVRRLDLPALRRHVGAVLAATRRMASEIGSTINKQRELTGVLLNELSIAPAALAEAVGARAALPVERRRILADLVRREPQQLAPALEMVDWATSASPARHGPGPAGGSVIPRLITQFWHDPIVPPAVARLIGRWQAVPGFSHRLLSAAAARQMIRERLEPRHVRAFINAGAPTRQADYARLAALYLDGGLYADADDAPRADPTALLAAGAELVVYREWLGTLGNNVIAVAPRHPVIARALEWATEALLAADNESTFLALGPGLLTRAVAVEIAGREGEATLPAGLTILSFAEMSRLVAMHRPVGYKGTPQHWNTVALAGRGLDLDWAFRAAGDDAAARGAA
jgi:Flp pilus assembly protein TadD